MTAAAQIKMTRWDRGRLTPAVAIFSSELSAAGAGGGGEANSTLPRDGIKEGAGAGVSASTRARSSARAARLAADRTVSAKRCNTWPSEAEKVLGWAEKTSRIPMVFCP